MIRLALAAALAVLALPVSAPAAPPAEGHIESDGRRIEILGRPLRAGDRIELPEGYLQVEEEGTEEGAVGSFGVVSAGSFAAAEPAPLLATTAGEPADAGETPRAAACGKERSAYLAELWRQSGIDFGHRADDPLLDPAALLEGLQSGTGAATGYYWFALATDAFRPLAWSSELRDRAKALVRCMRAL